jgi:hypothetical protein
MQPERILMIGEGGLGPYRVANFFDTTNYNEFEVAFWFPSSFGRELQSRNIRLSDPHSAEQAKNLTEAAATRITKWIAVGHSLIVFTSIPFVWPLWSGGQYTLSDLPFVEGTRFDVSRGELIEWCGPPAGRSSMELCLPALSYEVLLTGKDLQPLFKVSSAISHKIQIVGAMRKLGDGDVFFVPPIKSARDTGAWEIYINYLAELPKLLKQPKLDFPAWSALYQFQDEMSALARKLEIETKIDDLRVKISEQQVIIDAARDLKALFFGTGDHFKDAVATVLSELGLQVVDGPHPRADLIGFNGERILAIEAKGVDGPVREVNYRQAEQWAAEIRRTLAADPDERQADPDLRRYAEKLSELGVDINRNAEGRVDCKPLLIVGTFRKTPLDHRNEQDFPDQVARTIKGSTACAITGLQLLGLLIEARRRPDFKADALASLFSTNGVFRSAENWQGFLTKAGEVSNPGQMGP